MKHAVLHSLIALGLAASAQFAAAVDGDPARGESLTSSCAACHAADGNSPSPAFPKLAGQGEEYLFKQLQDIKAGNAGETGEGARPVPQMAGLLEDFSDQDLADIAAYFAAQAMQLAGAEDIKVQIYTGEQVDGLELGKQVYRAGNPEVGVPACTGCHSPRGLGNAPAGYPRLGGQFADYIATQLKDFRAGNRVNDPQQIMRDTAKNMSDAEIEAVANFIAGLH